MLIFHQITMFFWGKCARLKKIGHEMDWNCVRVLYFYLNFITGTKKKQYPPVILIDSHQHRPPSSPSRSWWAAPRGTPSPSPPSSRSGTSRSGLWSRQTNRITKKSSKTSDCHNRCPPCDVWSPLWTLPAWPSMCPTSEKASVRIFLYVSPCLFNISYVAKA